jgi:lysozyme family protein
MWKWLKKIFKNKPVDVPVEKPVETPVDKPDEIKSNTSKPDYGILLKSVSINDWGNVQFGLIESRILKAKSRYEYVANVVNVPWQLVAALHYREASLNFNTMLHNGDPLPGPTTHVPRGRGPFKSWEEAAIDALKYDEVMNLSVLEECLKFAESFNGFGYRSKGIYSPYVWSGTNHYKSGKYVADHVYNSTKRDDQLGVAVILLKLS